MVLNRIKAEGRCVIRYGNGYPGVSTEKMGHHEWDIVARESPGARPSASSSTSSKEAPSHLGDGTRTPHRFRFPGTRGTGTGGRGRTRCGSTSARPAHPPVPNVPYEGDEDAMVAAFAAAGWTRQLPGGFQTLYAFTQEYGTMTDGSPWWDPGPVLAETGVQLSWENRVRQLATVYREWDASHTGTGTASLNAFVWWRSWIGYAWELVHDDSITSLRVHRRSGARREQVSINGRENVLRWAINHLVHWAAQSIDAWFTSHDTSIVSSTLSEPSLGHVESDGTVGDIRVGAVDEADWVRYQGPSYREAGGIVSQVTVSAGDRTRR